MNKVLVLGSGPIVIGQAAEFDYAGTEACLALQEAGMEVVLLNNNPATIMTDETIADHVYLEPMSLTTLEKIINKERPDGMIGTLGGQTGLNLTLKAFQSGLLEKYNVELLGSSVEAIQNGEDRERFRTLMNKLNEPVSDSYIVTNLDDAISYAEKISYPVIVRPAYTLGGAGGGFAENKEQLQTIVTSGLSLSPINQVLIEQSIKGWKEIELEVIRDVYDDVAIVCSMENIDPVGVHTGDSVVVAPAMTWTDDQKKMLYDSAVSVIRNLGVVGACNIQVALAQDGSDYTIIEVNPRVSRSSALASKATGCPIAKIATNCALGHSLNTYFPKKTTTVHELMIDYTVVKIPRFSFDKFPAADRKLGTQMKATGETMAIDQTLEAALNKAIRSLDNGLSSLHHPLIDGEEESVLLGHMQQPTDLRLFAIAEVFRHGKRISEVYQLTSVSKPFLQTIQRIVEMEEALANETLATISADKLYDAKQMQISDQALAAFLNTTEQQIREKQKDKELNRDYHVVQSENHFPYFYGTWQSSRNRTPQSTEEKNVLIIGSGPIRIGQGMEFDYSSVQAVYALKKMGYTTVIVNNNPETVSTDSAVADRLYFEPLTVEDILGVIEVEQVEGVFIQFGGQTAINIARQLTEAGVNIYGTTPENIDLLEDRRQFYELLERIDVPHIAGEMAYSFKEMRECARKIGFPVLVRPSYVIGGQSMLILHEENMLDTYLTMMQQTEQISWPMLIDQFTPGVEAEIDLISDGEHCWIPAIAEHIEPAGVHSGDSIAVMPPVQLTEQQQKRLIEYATKICREANIVGLVNMQFVITDHAIYTLEVNPRSSRTIPLISKVTGMPMVEQAIRTQLGEKLKYNYLPEKLPFYAVKAPIFSAAKLDGVDPQLEAEMKSTGEVLGIAPDYEEALAKALNTTLFTLQSDTKKPCVFCSISDRKKPNSIPLLQQIQEHYTVLATSGTSEFLTKNGIANRKMDRSETEIAEMFAEAGIAGAIVIPNGLRTKQLGQFIRTQAIMHQVPLFTSLETLKVVMHISEQPIESVISLQEYHTRYSTV